MTPPRLEFDRPVMATIRSSLKKITHDREQMERYFRIIVIEQEMYIAEYVKRVVDEDYPQYSKLFDSMLLLAS
jgi:hypothetical protein